MREEIIKFRDVYVINDNELHDTKSLSEKNEDIIKTLINELEDYVKENNIKEFTKESEVFMSKHYRGELLKDETCVLIELRLKY